MALRLGRTGEGERRLFLQRHVGGYAARLFLPALDRLGVGHDLDLPLVIGKAHPPAETLLIETAQLRLISVMIGRAEQDPAQPVSAPRGEIAFDRFGLSDLGAIKIVLFAQESAVLENAPVARDRAVVAQLEERAVSAFRRTS